MSLFAQHSKFKRFFLALMVFLLSAGTIAIVRDQYVMVDFILMLGGIYGMWSTLRSRDFA